MRYYDSTKRCLVYEAKSRSDPNFWDDHWAKDDWNEIEKKGKNDRFVSKITKKFLKPSRSVKILESGCGKGQYVYALNHCGYDAYGVDFAKITVERVNNNFPHLKIRLGDIRQMDFPNNFFDAYWSLGVIEHFYEGYLEILEEMHRILKPGGYAFVTFPYMSPLRKLRAKLGRYPEYQEDRLDISRFFQFALDVKRVQKDFSKKGFELVYKQPFDGIKGLKDELDDFPSFQKFFNAIYYSQIFFVKIIKYSIHLSLAPVCGHIILMVFRKKIESLA
jgi:SAM-dependent methyltransferase